MNYINKGLYINWLEDNSKDLNELCEGINSNLWEKTLIFQEKTILKKKEQARKNLKQEYICRAGTEFLYFMTLLIKPNTVVETGVGIGFSSLAILTAMEENKQGKLFSSDLPYFRYEKSVFIPTAFRFPIIASA